MDVENFRAFEHAGWVNVPVQYHETFGSLTTQTIPVLLDVLRVETGLRLLDIATGPGYVAGAAAQHGADVVAVDFSSAMIAKARRTYPEVDFREGDAEQLPLPANVFDAAVMNFGILHLARPDQALREACRVLKSGGRFAFTAWAPPEETVGFRIVLRAVQEHGTVDVQLPEGPPFFRFGDPAECSRALTEAGFRSVNVVKIPQLWRLAAGDGLFNAMKESTVRTAGLLQRQSPDALRKIADAVRTAAAPYVKDDIVELPMPALIASGAKL